MDDVPCATAGERMTTYKHESLLLQRCHNLPILKPFEQICAPVERLLEHLLEVLDAAVVVACRLVQRLQPRPA